MRKGFSSLMTSIDTALKPSPDDMSDTISVRSDGSSDSEKFILIPSGNENERTFTSHTVDAMFRVAEFHNDSKTLVEMASEVLEEESTVTTTSDHSLTSSFRRKDIVSYLFKIFFVCFMTFFNAFHFIYCFQFQVSVSTFKLTKVEFLQQSFGYSSSIKVQVGNIMSEDCASIPWDEFQVSGFCGGRNRVRIDVDTNTLKGRCIEYVIHDPRTEIFLYLIFFACL